MERRYKTYPTDIAVQPDSRTIGFTISTGSIDRDGDILDPKGWQLDNYKKNPVVLFAHDYHQLPVAKATAITQTAAGLQATAEFPPKGTYPFADTVFDMLKAGFLSATSVGFQPIDHEPAKDRGKGFNFKSQELLEFSIVPIPSNAEALATQREVDIPEQTKVWMKALRDWAQPAMSAVQERVGSLVGATPFWVGKEAAWADLEKDYAIEAESGELTDARLAKLLALHGFTQQAAQIIPKAPGARAMYGKMMDAADSADKAAGCCDECMGTKVISNEQKAKVKEAKQHAITAREAAREAADACHAQMTGKTVDAPIVAYIVSGDELATVKNGVIEKLTLTKPLPSPEPDEAEKDFIHRCMGAEAIQSDFSEQDQRVAVCYSQWRRHQKPKAPSDHELYLELADEPVEKDTEIDEVELTELITQKLSEVVGDSVRASLNQALGRLPEL